MLLIFKDASNMANAEPGRRGAGGGEGRVRPLGGALEEKKITLQNTREPQLHGCMHHASAP
eukprot:11974562-Karenia_brevis.AAC.1